MNTLERFYSKAIEGRPLFHKTAFYTYKYVLFCPSRELLACVSLSYSTQNVDDLKSEIFNYDVICSLFRIHYFSPSKSLPSHSRI